MSVIFLLITASTLVAGVFLIAFITAVRSGQFDDDRSPAVRILDEPVATMPMAKVPGDARAPRDKDRSPLTTDSSPL